jgi:hypothetical protein
MTEFVLSPLEVFGDPPIERPACEECGCPAEIVCASPYWGPTGFDEVKSPDNVKARFCCRDHTDWTGAWYWAWLIPLDETDRRLGFGDGITLQDWDDLQHVAQKTWGGAFIGWLFNAYNLRESD